MFSWKQKEGWLGDVRIGVCLPKLISTLAGSAGLHSWLGCPENPGFFFTFSILIGSLSIWALVNTLPKRWLCDLWAQWERHKQKEWCVMVEYHFRKTAFSSWQSYVFGSLAEISLVRSSPQACHGIQGRLGSHAFLAGYVANLNKSGY